MYEPLAELWARIRGKRPEPIVQQEEVVKSITELTDEQILEQLFHKLGQPREVVLITISKETKPTLSAEDAFLRNWHFPTMYKLLARNSLFQGLVAIPWRWNTQGGGTIKRSRLRLNKEWGAWLVAGIPHVEERAPTEIYLRLDPSSARMVHPLLHQSTNIHNALVSNTCLLLGCRIAESRYFNDSYIYRLESAQTHDFYKAFLEMESETH